MPSSFPQFIPVDENGVPIVGAFANLSAYPQVQLVDTNGAIVSSIGTGTGGGGGSGTSITWSAVSGNAALSPDNGYICANDSILQTLTLPISATTGQTISIIGSSTGLFRIAQRVNQKIVFGNLTTATGTAGRIDSQSQGDAIALIYAGSNAWVVQASNGTFDIG